MTRLGQDVRVVMLAGGQGERLWPKSTRRLPKQFLRMDGSKSLLRQTFERATQLVDPAAVYVVTGSQYADLTRQELPELPARNLILEPVGRNTAPAIGLAALYLERTSGDVTMVTLPSDHAIRGLAEFRSAISASVLAARQGDLATIGIRPTRPETGYGYIQVEPTQWMKSEAPALPVTGFIEKPDLDLATRIFQSGCYLWNSGILVLKIESLWRELSRHMPELSAAFQEIRSAAATPDELLERAAAKYPELPSRSIDYGILEHSDRVVVTPAAFEWNDVGDWNAIGRTRPRDEQGNTVTGPGFLYATTGTTVESESDRLVAVVGGTDLIVVDTPSVVLICDKNRAQEVRQIAGPASALAEALDRQRGPEGQMLERPWGREICWAQTAHYAARQIDLLPGQVIPLRRHARTHKTLCVLAGTVRLRLGDERCEVGPGKVITIPPGTPHRLAALSPVTLMEVSTPETDDLVWLEED